VSRRQLNVRFQEEDWERLAHLQQSLGQRSQYEVLHLAMIALEKEQCSETFAPPTARETISTEQPHVRTMSREDWCQRCRRLGIATCPACKAMQAKGR
jgi:hypothetical protein